MASCFLVLTLAVLRPLAEKNKKSDDRQKRAEEYWSNQERSFVLHRFTELDAISRTPRPTQTG